MFANQNYELTAIFFFIRAEQNYPLFRENYFFLNIRNYSLCWYDSFRPVIQIMWQRLFRNTVYVCIIFLRTVIQTTSPFYKPCKNDCFRKRVYAVTIVAITYYVMQGNSDGKKKLHQYQQNKTAINSTIVTVIKDLTFE